MPNPDTTKNETITKNNRFITCLLFCDDLARNSFFESLTSFFLLVQPPLLQVAIINYLQYFARAGLADPMKKSPNPVIACATLIKEMFLCYLLI